MYLQDDKASCGAVALANALKALGKDVAPSACGKLAGTNATTGTQPAGLRKAIEALGHVPAEIHTERIGDAWVHLKGHLGQGHPVILLVDRESHWVTVVGAIGDRVLVADSGDSKVVESMAWDQLLIRWEARGKKKPFYGIAVAG